VVHVDPFACRVKLKGDAVLAFRSVLIKKAGVDVSLFVRSRIAFVGTEIDQFLPVESVIQYVKSDEFLQVGL